MLNWVDPFNIFCFLHSNNYRNELSRFQWMLACEPLRIFEAISPSEFDGLEQFISEKPGWLFGHLGFSLQTFTEGIVNTSPCSIPFQPAFFFQAGIRITCNLDGDIIIDCSSNFSPEDIFQQIQSTPVREIISPQIHSLQPVISKDVYTEKIEQLLHHINRGNFYELNFCYEFTGSAELHPLSTFLQLNGSSPNPFAAFYRLRDTYCFCASPERYIQRSGDKIISQPIKGTGRRNLHNISLDKIIADDLLSSEKDLSENTMVVDLVRNDLSKVAIKNTVKVEELCALKTYPLVHHLVSTISAEVKSGIRFTDIMNATFPMGSMTGAPKHKVLEITAETETGCRGLYSGSIGYITPQGDFDFNVVIRSLFFDAANQKISFWVGGGITTGSDAEREYEETLVKAAALLKLLGKEDYLPL